MKKNSKLISILVATNVLTLFIMFIGCQDPVPPPGPTPATNCYAGSSNQTSFPGLSALLVKSLVDNYRNRQLSAINGQYYTNAGAEGGTPADGDARSVWFDMEVIKRFIYEIESKTCDACTTPTKTLGIRIYYGTYPDTSVWSDPVWAEALEGVDPSYAGKHTVMFVPTYRDSTGADIDFDPNHVNSSCDFSVIDDFYNKMKSGNPANVTLTVLSSINTSVQNHGQMVPPPYDDAQILNRGAGIMYAADHY